MSIKYLNDAWDMPINSAEKILLLAIADCANNEGYAYPGYETLVKKTGMSKATLSKCMKVLKGVGILKSESHANIGKGKKVNTYTISLRCELSISSDRELIEKIRELRKINSNAISLHLEQRKVHTANTVSLHREHESFIEPPVIEPPVIEIDGSKKPTRKRTPKYPEEFILPEWVDAEKWDLWIKTRGKKMIAEQKYAQLAKLEKWKDAGLDHAAALANSADNGYQGLFEPRSTVTQGINNDHTKTGPSTGRKLSLIDEAQAAIDRIEARERRDRERVIN